MDCLNVREAEKIQLVQGQDAGQAISRHDRGKTCIVNLHSAHIVRDHELAPDRIDLFIVGEKRHLEFDLFDARPGLCG